MLVEKKALRCGYKGSCGNLVLMIVALAGEFKRLSMVNVDRNGLQ